MAGKRLKGIVGVMVAGSMFASSTAAAASQQISPWATLTVLTGGAPAAAVCGAAAGVAAAQPTSGCVLPVMDTPPPVANGPPPPPPVAPLAATAGYGITPLLLGLVAIAAAVGLSWSRTRRPTRHRIAISSQAERSETRPLARGRRRVRSTRASKSLSTMSL